MHKILVFILLGSLSLKSVADVPEDLRGRPKQHKLIVHSCDAKNLSSISCRVVSDINLGDVISSLKSDRPYIESVETIEVKKGLSPEGFVLEEAPYWKTCDAEDGDCIEWSVGAFRNYVVNQYSLTISQRDAILNKIDENTLEQNTHLYFFNRNTTAGKSFDDGTTIYSNLARTKLVVK